MDARHGARTHFPTLQPYHNKTFLPRHVHELCGRNHQTDRPTDIASDRAAVRVRLLGTKCNICLAAQLFVLTSVVAHAIFWRPPPLVTYPDFYKRWPPAPPMCFQFGGLQFENLLKLVCQGRGRRLFSLSRPCRSV